MLALFLALNAHAADRVLVLPLDGDGTRPGLGEALSVWLNEELANSPELAVVPRSEVEAAMPTGASAPITLNLDYAISGSWAVIGGDLSLSLRVGPSELRARGALGDFVLVEQDLAAQLRVALSGSGSAAPIPTEKLDALTAYGRGLEARRAGKQSEARAAFADAMALDPRFTTARDALAALAGDELPQHPMRTAHDAIYAKYPALTAAPTDQAALVGFALRLMALEGDGLHCQRAEEMAAYLGFVDYQVSLPSGLTDAALATAVATEARALRFTAMPRSVADQPDGVYAMPQRRVAGQFSTTADFLFREASARNTLGSGLFGALAHCHAPAEAQREFAEHATAALAKGQADQLQLGRPAPGWTLRESIELAWATLQAEQGSTPDFEKRLDALTATRSASDPVQQQLLDRSRDLRDKAGRAVRVDVRAPATEREVLAALRGAADGAANVVDADIPGCAHALESRRGELYSWVSQVGTTSMEDVRVRTEHQREGQILASALAELGCLQGQPPVHASPEAARTSVTQRLDALPPGSLSKGTCGDQNTKLRTLLGTPPSPEAAVDWVFAMQRIEHECR
ncbi:MAG: hypothetical protein EP330_19140 [Deltaproteobacteria bacterium]|nr:MAG: hypothetical protein EP330_19140 [Deltaproteobacteria bacterium]